MEKTRVILGGALGAEFGREWEFFLETKAEALRMISVNCAGFREKVEKMVAEGLNFTVEFNGVGVMDEDELRMPAGGTLVIMPTMQGAGGGNAGFFQILAGAALIGASFIPGLQVATAGYLLTAGIGVAAMGAISLIAPQPRIGDLGTSDSEGKKSYYFDGAEDTGEQGAAIAIIYGRNKVSQSQTVHAAIDIQ